MGEGDYNSVCPRSGKKVTEQLFEANQPNISLSIPLNDFGPLHFR